MDIAAIFREYDGMFGAKPVDEIERFLDAQIAAARSERDEAALFSLLNESVGLARNLRRREKALRGCDELLRLADELNIRGRAQYATALLNIATAYSVFERCEAAQALFQETEALLRQSEAARPYEWASLYNNWSLLCAQQGRFDEGAALQRSALSHLDALEGAEAERATSRANLASILLRRFEAERAEALLDEAERSLREGLSLFRTAAPDSFHLGTALITLGDLLMARRAPADAAAAYREAMDELERTIGRGVQYERARQLCERAEKEAAT